MILLYFWDVNYNFSLLSLILLTWVFFIISLIIIIEDLLLFLCLHFFFLFEDIISIDSNIKWKVMLLGELEYRDACIS